ncbi:Hypothetical_protein [Hexamita inflata]|uniref:Hypothetical_protein n=1 Tax=Hexamita inflata TaxID=28002 RepID=A0AA86QNF8_9EUKA|nr:Hypothetical protein HINF_LOCUS43899 [Hexamita inflata]
MSQEMRDNLAEELRSKYGSVVSTEHYVQTNKQKLPKVMPNHVVVRFPNNEASQLFARSIQLYYKQYEAKYAEAYKKAYDELLQIEEDYQIENEVDSMYKADMRTIKATIEELQAAWLFAEATNQEVDKKAILIEAVRLNVWVEANSY